MGIVTNCWPVLLEVTCGDCMGKPGRDPRRSRVDLCRSRLDICRSRVDICRSEVERINLIFSTICDCQKLKIF